MRGHSGPISGRSVERTPICQPLLNNPLYIGKVVRKGETFNGEHEAIVPQDLWDRVQAALAENHKVRGNRARAKTPALLSRPWPNSQE